METGTKMLAKPLILFNFLSFTTYFGLGHVKRGLYKHEQIKTSLYASVLFQY